VDRDHHAHVVRGGEQLAGSCHRVRARAAMEQQERLLDRAGRGEEDDYHAFPGPRRFASAGWVAMTRWWVSRALAGFGELVSPAGSWLAPDRSWRVTRIMNSAMIRISARTPAETR
jgi:hypothetical protein